MIPEQDVECCCCKENIPMHTCGHPAVELNGVYFCSDCSLALMQPMYEINARCGLSQLVSKELLRTCTNRKRRPKMRDYKKTFNELCKKYNFECQMCGKSEGLTVDHITPWSRGGTDEFHNLQILCKSCNSKKGTKTMQELGYE